MIRNKNFIPLLLTIVSATTGISLSKQVENTNASSGEWSPCTTQPISISDVDNGVKLENTSGWGTRAYYKEKLTIDGLSFDWKVDNLSEGDCRGFAFHSTGLPYDYFADAGFQPSSVFTAWQIFTQSRFYIGSSHDYNQTPINYTDTNKTNVGFSNAGGHLIMTRSENYTLNFAFEKVDDIWYKITMKATNVTMWQANNYGTDIINNSIVTYITEDDLKVDENGKAWLITVAMAKQNKDLSDAVYFLNMNYQTGIEASISKSEYKVNEDLDLSSLKVSKVFKNGNKAEIDPSKVTISGYNKKVSGNQTIKISYQGYETSFEVKVIKEYTAMEFANDFLSLTNDVCANSDEDNAAKLLPIWNQLKSSEYYQKLAIDEIEILINTTYSSDSTSAIELAMKRYDHIIERYGLENFIKRPVNQYSNSIIKITSSDENNTITIIAAISFIAISLVASSFIIKKRKEEQ